MPSATSPFDELIETFSRRREAALSVFGNTVYRHDTPGQS